MITFSLECVSCAPLVYYLNNVTCPRSRRWRLPPAPSYSWLLRWSKTKTRRIFVLRRHFDQLLLRRLSSRSRPSDGSAQSPERNRVGELHHGEVVGFCILLFGVAWSYREMVRVGKTLAGVARHIIVSLYAMRSGCGRDACMYGASGRLFVFRRKRGRLWHCSASSDTICMIS